MKKGLLVFLSAFLLLTANSVSAAPRDGMFLGEANVEFGNNRDVIHVGAYDGRFREVVFEIEKNNIEIYGIEIVFADGQREKIDTRLSFDEHNRSIHVPLVHGERRIQRIEFAYKPVGMWGLNRGHIIVYGIK